MAPMSPWARVRWELRLIVADLLLALVVWVLPRDQMGGAMIRGIHQGWDDQTRLEGGDDLHE